MTESLPDKPTIRRAFERAAATYDAAAGVQREICDQLSRMLRPHANPPTHTRILDAGCGTGFGLEVLRSVFPASTRIGLDFAPAMLERIPRSTSDERDQFAVCGDLEDMPFPDQMFDAVWSSLATQWCSPGVALSEIARVTRKGGGAWIATLGPGTLQELRDAFSLIDKADHVLHFHPLAIWQAAASTAGFEIVECRNPLIFALASDLRALLRQIKAIGAHSLPSDPRRRPIGRGAWRSLEQQYERHRRPDGLLPASYDTILFSLRKR